MTPRIEFEVSDSVWRVLQRRVEDTGRPMGAIVDDLLAEALDLDRHSVFQISTSNALIRGVFGGTTTVDELRRHGDFGLGTFAGLDGEMVLVDGECFRAGPGGVAERVDGDRQVPFALVTHFQSDLESRLETPFDFETLTKSLDALRPSENIFVGIRVEATFDSLSMRVACRASPGEGLLEATRHQDEFTVSGISGVLVGFWAPEYSKSVSVPGYHLHFISDDRALAGHVLGLRGDRGMARLHTESDVHLALPETTEFLTADLTGDHLGALREAESERR